MNLPQLIIKVDLEEVWLTGQTVDHILEKAGYVLDNYSTLREAIAANLLINQVLVSESLTNIFDQIMRE